jgi:hypothetical protein
MADKAPKKTSNPVLKFFSNLAHTIKKLFKPEKSLIGLFPSWEEVKLEISPEVTRYLEMRHVQEEQLKQVIYYAETTGDKLYQPDANRFLGKLRIGKATFYADYSYGEGCFIIKYGYAHRSEIAG